jgi:hypothetical protein
MRLLSILVKELGNCSVIGGPRESPEARLMDINSGYLAGEHFRVCENLICFSTGQVLIGSVLVSESMLKRISLKRGVLALIDPALLLLQVLRYMRACL